ncbi:DUF7010 family protein [Agreia pratensis]|uniref:Uncharacterized protein n=1 Tax=Agreia pratensis TaxID=150121 RepID=A0A1X7L346_9MICO|nr:hypothetical protein [Agreia pratensis]SMG48266.1 hypothetical protein SAMN06296010_3294 [Agreia pratensis]
MDISEAQADVRRVYRAGFPGPAVSAVVWAVANAVFVWGSATAGMVVLFVGGMLIFPLTTLVLKVMGGTASLPKGHPSTSLAMQSAFTVPFGLLVALVLGAYEPALFFPASLIIVGAHYLVFVSLYGMRLFAVLAAVLIVVGTLVLFLLPSLGSISGWLGAAVFAIFAVVLFRAARDH